jgi:hypothetical protein
MVAHLTACILALATMRTAPVEIYHRQFRGDTQERAEHLALSIHSAAEIYGVDAELLLALGWLESAFDRDRVSSVGCASIMQLCGRSRAVYERSCSQLRSQYACDGVAVMLAAVELRDGLTVCGSESGAVSRYRTGRCDAADSWRVQQVLALRDDLGWGAP